MPTAKGKEHFKSIEEYLLDRGWRKQTDGKRWWPGVGPNFLYILDAFVHQISMDLDEVGWDVTGITLEKR